MRKAIAIDFDGCLCTDAFPAIGKPNWDVIDRAKAEQQAGAGLILWTCREDRLLQEAVEACRGWGLTFDALNESLPDWIEEFQTTPRKIGASEYWDDKAIQTPAKQCLVVQPKRLTTRDVRTRIDPVWCLCNTPDGGDGFWCLCDCGIITAPSGWSFVAGEIPEWEFYDGRPDPPHPFEKVALVPGIN